MHFSTLLIAGAALTPAVFAAPSSSAFTKRNEPYSCAATYSKCVGNEGADVSFCQQQQQACDTCVGVEASCRDGADYSKQLQCTVDAQRCLFQAVGSGSLNGGYTCEQSFATCKAAPMENNAYCASEDSGCQSCAEQENACRTAPNANQSFCASQVSECFFNVTSLN